MKDFLIFSILSVCILSGCNKSPYSYLDKKSYYIFEKGDTLIYKGTSVSDTFYVATKEKSFRSLDKRDYIEIWRFNLQELTKACKDSTYDYCWGMIITRDAEKLTSVDFRNDFTSSVESFPIIS
jgi:hypothetical protein